MKIPHGDPPFQVNEVADPVVAWEQPSTVDHCCSMVALNHLLQCGSSDLRLHDHAVKRSDIVQTGTPRTSKSNTLFTQSMDADKLIQCCFKPPWRLLLKGRRDRFLHCNWQFVSSAKRTRFAQ